MKKIRMCVLTVGLLLAFNSQARSQMCPVDGGQCVGSSFTPVPVKKVPRILAWVSRQFGIWRQPR